MKPWFDRPAIKIVVFFTLIATIVFCMLILILAIWGAFDDNTEIRDNWLLTVAVIASGILLMCLTNWSFLIGDEARAASTPPLPESTPMSRALIKAKTMRSDAPPDSSSA